MIHVADWKSIRDLNLKPSKFQTLATVWKSSKLNSYHEDSLQGAFEFANAWNGSVILHHWKSMATLLCAAQHSSVTSRFLTERSCNKTLDLRVPALSGLWTSLPLSKSEWFKREVPLESSLKLPLAVDWLPHTKNKHTREPMQCFT